MSTRQVTAKLVGVNPHYLSDARFLRRHAGSETIAKLRDGTLGMQEALRQAGRLTPRDRQRQRRELTRALCQAVLDGEIDNAKFLAELIMQGSGKWQWFIRACRDDVDGD